MDEMDKKAVAIVRYWIGKNLGPGLPDYKEFIVWKAKILQNWKYLISTDIPDGRYYELTYNGLYHEWYLDVYRKEKNQKFMDDTVRAEIVRKVENDLSK